MALHAHNNKWDSQSCLCIMVHVKPHRVESVTIRCQMIEVAEYFIQSEKKDFQHCMCILADIHVALKMENLHEK